MAIFEVLCEKISDDSHAQLSEPGFAILEHIPTVYLFLAFIILRRQNKRKRSKLIHDLMQNLCLSNNLYE
jgi:hypothetical protein